jgi:hypothetical protein
MPSGGLGPVPPQQPDEMVPPSDPTGRAGEVDQERKVFPPEEIGWRRATVQDHVDRPERTTEDHLHLA